MTDVQGSLFGEAYVEPEVPRDPEVIRQELYAQAAKIGARADVNPFIPDPDSAVVSEATVTEGHDPRPKPKLPRAS